MKQIYDGGILRGYGIEYSAPVGFGACRVINERKLAALRRTFEPVTVITFLVPYYTGNEDRNISKYAISKDYHLFMRGLFNDIIPAFEAKYGGRFAGMADSSPVDEVAAAARAGLGVIGDSGLLINEKYGPYVFIGALYSSEEFESGGDLTRRCCHCGACKKACPANDGRECLSYITQKKGALTGAEEEYLREFGSVWGCDICADVCPHSRAAQKTTIGFFYEDRTPTLTAELVENMSEDEFSDRAYSWRGRQTVIRNLEILYGKKE